MGDIWHQDKRGKALAAYSIAPLLGPSMGPVLAAWIAEKTTCAFVHQSTSSVLNSTLRSLVLLVDQHPLGALQSRLGLKVHTHSSSGRGASRRPRLPPRILRASPTRTQSESLSQVSSRDRSYAGPDTLLRQAEDSSSRSRQRLVVAVPTLHL